MELGPLNTADADGIAEILTTRNINFEIVVDEDLKDEILKKYNSDPLAASRLTSGPLDLSFIFFEIADEDFEKVKDVFEKYAISPSTSDGSYELGED